jgi:uncharacterized protein YqeY
MSELKNRLTEEMKAAMKAKEKVRLSTIRSIQAAIKQVEIDEQIELDDAAIIKLMTKMQKQRRDSLQQFSDAGRTDLAEVEEAELATIADFMPQALSEAALSLIIEKAISDSGAASMQEMGKVMALVKAQAEGRADMAEVSKMIKVKLG